MFKRYLTWLVMLSNVTLISAVTFTLWGYKNVLNWSLLFGLLLKVKLFFVIIVNNVDIFDSYYLTLKKLQRVKIFGRLGGWLSLLKHIKLLEKSHLFRTSAVLSRDAFMNWDHNAKSKNCTFLLSRSLPYVSAFSTQAQQSQNG